MKKFETIFKTLAFSVALWFAAQIVYAITADAPLLNQNGHFSITGPANRTSSTAHGVAIGNGTNPENTTAAGAALQCLCGNGVSVDPTFQTVPVSSALAANGSNCSATGEAAKGVAANGDAEGCFIPPYPPLSGTSFTDLTTNQTVFSGAGTSDSTEARAAFQVPAGTWGNLRCNQTTASGVGNVVACVLRKGAVGALADTAATCNMSGASAAACSDVSDIVTTTAGQYMSIKITTPNVVTNNQYVVWSLERLS